MSNAVTKSVSERDGGQRERPDRQEGEEQRRADGVPFTFAQIEEPGAHARPSLHDIAPGPF